MQMSTWRSFFPSKSCASSAVPAIRSQLCDPVAVERHKADGRQANAHVRGVKVVPVRYAEKPRRIDERLDVLALREGHAGGRDPLHHVGLQRVCELTEDDATLQRVHHGSRHGLACRVANPSQGFLLVGPAVSAVVGHGPSHSYDSADALAASALHLQPRAAAPCPGRTRLGASGWHSHCLVARATCSLPTLVPAPCARALRVQRCTLATLSLSLDTHTAQASEDSAGLSTEERAAAEATASG